MSRPAPPPGADLQAGRLAPLYEAMFAAQARLIAAMGLSPLDPRLAPARDEARRRRRSLPVLPGARS